MNVEPEPTDHDDPRPGLPTPQLASLVFGDAGVPLDDPTEAYHEASRLYPSLAPERLEMLAELSRNPELGDLTSRAGRTHDHRPSVALPAAATPSRLFADLLADRRSAFSRRGEPIALAQLAQVLESSYGAHERPGGALRRPVPSAGALYPLEVYVVPLSVVGIAPAVYHYHPFAHRLHRLGPTDRGDVGAALVDASLLDSAAAVVVVTAVFWRSRFKYGARGYRFALLEAGHLGQNALLAATVAGLAAAPIGGFFDRRLDALVGADGLDEAAVYAIVLGSGR